MISLQTLLVPFDTSPAAERARRETSEALRRRSLPPPKGPPPEPDVIERAVTAMRDGIASVYYIYIYISIIHHTCSIYDIYTHAFTCNVT
jgi:hypothetical protein